jgi:formylglycine-generating enzyme required for sulfatase activity/serine/threonine protein kinase
MTDESIFTTAAALKTESERQAYLDDVCKDNPELRAEVEALLKADAGAGSFLNHPPVGTDATIAMSSDHDTVDANSGPVSLAFLQPCDTPGRIGKIDHYEVVEVVGQGGMGVVLRAFDTKLSRIVAVKVMAPELAANPTAVKRFLREASTAAAVHHDHVVTIHAVGDHHRPPYIVMQFIDGQTLQQKIDREGALELKQILRIGSQMAAGLAAAHKHGLIHRDVKPANILLENGVERVKITDFGLARAADDLEMTQTGMIAGTPQYMSPEQAKGEPVDARSDIFSLGSVLYTMCTGRPGFRAETTMGVLKRVCDESPRPIREVNAEIPPWLEAIIGKLLAKNPADRFQSAAEVSELLGQHLAHVQNPAQVPRPATVSLPAIPTQPVKESNSADRLSPRQRHRRSMAIATAICAFLALAAAVIAFVVREANMPPQIITIYTDDPDVTVTIDDRLSPRSKLSSQRISHPNEPAWVGGPNSAYVEFWSTAVKPGEHRVRALRGFQVIYDEMITLKRGEQKTIDLKGRTSVAVLPASWPSGAEEVYLLAASADDWTPLFNGQDLTGWSEPSDAPSAWDVVDGLLVGKGVYSYLVSDHTKFRDFHLRAEVRINEGGNSGIYFRSELLADWQTRGCIGYEAEISTKEPGGKTGSLRSYPQSVVLQKIDEPLVPPGQWFTYEVIAAGSQISTFVNGKLAASVTDNAHPQGRLALQLLAPETTVVEFRKIEIRDLANQQPTDGFVQLFNGTDRTGWNLNPDSSGFWRVEEGVLIGGPSNEQGMLHTERDDFEDFHLRAEVKFEGDGADGGIFFRTATQASNELNFCFDPNLPNQQTGSLVVHRPETKDSVWKSAPTGLAKAGEWMTVEIIARGGQALTRINGKTAAISSELCGNLRGQIVLQHLGPRTVVRFRKIEIKELPSSAPPLAFAPFDEAQAKAHQDVWAKHLGVPVEIENSLGMKLRLIPPGRNAVGPSGDLESSSPFFISTCEVTVGQFRKFVDETGHKTTGETSKLGGMRVQAGEKTERRADYVWSNPDLASDETCPVTLITWQDAKAFCDWLSGKENRTYRLPVGAQYQWATQAGSDSAFYFGPAATDMDAHAWHKANSSWKVHPVGTKQTNPWGLFDVYGNVWELSYDWERGGQPVMPSAATAGPAGQDRIQFWGGGYTAPPEAGSQRATGPALVGYSHLGFRVAIVGDLRPRPPAVAVAPFDAVQAKSHQIAWATHLGVPVEIENSLGMKLQLIPPGEFLMGNTQAEVDQLARSLEEGGAPDYDKFASKTSGPQHRVRLTKPFRLSECEVTVGQYRKFIEATKHVPTMEQLGIKRFGWTSSAVEPDGEQRAVIGVSWEDAKAFCKWLSEQEGRTYDLPSEAQWEYACRAGTTTAWSFGDDASGLKDHAVFGHPSFWPADAVRSKAANPFGLFDMHGNADEWCLDWHQRDYYAHSPVDDPLCTTDPKVKGAGRVVRGGAAVSAPWWTRSTTRAFDFPATPNNPKGFRVAMVGDLKPIWTQLFNGRDLAGWKTHPDHVGAWSVSDGMLVGKGRKSWLFSERADFTNCHLRAEVQINDVGDSGIFVRADFDLDELGAPKRFMEANISAGGRDSKVGAIWGPALLADAQQQLVKAGEWFTFEVIASGGNVETKVNGVTAASAKDCPVHAGHIALQVFSDDTEVRFRKVEVKQLPPSIEGAKSPEARPVDAAPAGAAANSPEVAALRELVAAQVRNRDAAQASFEAGQVPRLDVVAAEVELSEAHIRLAEAEGTPAGAIAHLQELVKLRTEERKLVEMQVKAGISTPSALSAAEARLADAKARLAKAAAAIPAVEPPLPVPVPGPLR